MTVHVLVFALIVLLFAGTIVWGITRIPLPSPFNVLAICLVCLIAIAIVAQRAGVF